MARIPDKFANPDAPLRGDPGASVDTGNAIGSALQSVGQNVQSAASRQIAGDDLERERLKRARETTDLARRGAAALKEFSSHRDELEKQAAIQPAPDEEISFQPVNVAASFGSLADGTVEKLTSDIQDPVHKERVAARLTELRSSYETRIAALQQVQEKKLSVQAAGQVTQETVAQVFRDPTSFREMSAIGLEALKDPEARFDPAERMKAIADFQRASVKAAILGTIETDPARAQEILKRGHLLDDGGFVLGKFLTADDLRALGKAAAAKSAETDVLERYRVGQLIDSHLASVASTGQGVPNLTEERIAAAAGGGAKGRAAVEKFRDRESTAHAAFETATALRDATPAEAGRIIAELSPQSGDKDFATKRKLFDAALKEWDRISRERSEDPAGYVERTFAPLRAVEDPGAAARLNLTQQAEIGIHPSRRKVLSKARRDAVVADIQSAPAGERAGRIESLREVYGENFNRVMTELNAGKLDAQTQTLTALSGNLSASQTMAKAIETGQKELVKLMPDGFVLKEFRNGVRDEVSDFMAAVEFAAIGGTRVAQINAQIDAMTTLAMQYVVQGDSESAAIRKATEAVVLDQYDIRDRYYVPRLIGTERVNTGRVHAVLDARQGEEAIRAFNPFPFGAETMVPGAVEIDDLREQTIAAATDPNRAKWATRPDGTGAFLVVQDIAGAWQPLINELGDRYEVDFLAASKSEIVTPLVFPRAKQTPGERLRTAPLPGVTRLR